MKTFVEIPQAEARKHMHTETRIKALATRSLVCSEAPSLNPPPGIRWFVPAAAAQRPIGKPFQDSAETMGFVVRGDLNHIWVRADLSPLETVYTVAHELYHLLENRAGVHNNEAAAIRCGVRAVTKWFPGLLPK